MKKRATDTTFRNYAHDESGASLVEYSLLVGLVSIAILTAITSISGNLAIVWSTLATIVAQAAGG